MVNLTSFACLLGMAVLLTNCSVEVNAPMATTVAAENNLNAMEVEVSGAVTEVDGIDLDDVTVGDVYFESVAYGTTSASQVTYRYGEVSVDIGTAVVFTTVLNQTVLIPFSNISPMAVTITPETANTVVFDRNTAGVIFQSLARKPTDAAL